MLIQFLVNIANHMKNFWRILVKSIPAAIETGYFSQVCTLYFGKWEWEVFWENGGPDVQNFKLESMCSLPVF